MGLQKQADDKNKKWSKVSSRWIPRRNMKEAGIWVILFINLFILNTIEDICGKCYPAWKKY